MDGRKVNWRLTIWSSGIYPGWIGGHHLGGVVTFEVMVPREMAGWALRWTGGGDL
jgi:hypothetical protein